MVNYKLYYLYGVCIYPRPRSGTDYIPDLGLNYNINIDLDNKYNRYAHTYNSLEICF